MPLPRVPDALLVDDDLDAPAGVPGGQGTAAYLDPIRGYARGRQRDPGRLDGVRPPGRPAATPPAGRLRVPGEYHAHVPGLRGYELLGLGKLHIGRSLGDPIRAARRAGCRGGGGTLPTRAQYRASPGRGYGAAR
jgi:hypothetical protein